MHLVPAYMNEETCSMVKCGALRHVVQVEGMLCQAWLLLRMARYGDSFCTALQLEASLKSLGMFEHPAVNQAAALKAHCLLGANKVPLDLTFIRPCHVPRIPPLTHRPNTPANWSCVDVRLLAVMLEILEGEHA